MESAVALDLAMNFIQKTAARSRIAAFALPRGAPVEIEAIAEIA